MVNVLYPKLLTKQIIYRQPVVIATINDCNLGELSVKYLKLGLFLKVYPFNEKLW